MKHLFEILLGFSVTASFALLAIIISFIANVSVLTVIFWGIGKILSWLMLTIGVTFTWSWHNSLILAIVCELASIILKHIFK